MKHTKFLLTAFAAVIFVTFTNCCGNNAVEPQAEAEDTMQAEQPTFLTAIDDYLSTEIGASYSKGEVCIPNYTIVESDISDTSDIRVWGDWWVFNYTLAGDTLKCIAGGSHPGLMHLQQRADHSWEVVAFDQVEDGARNLSSAKRIFGQYYDAFHAVNSNQALRDSTRLAMVADYVKQHDVQAAYLQDYGWPAVEIGQ